MHEMGNDAFSLPPYGNSNRRFFACKEYVTDDHRY